jgi:3-phenylpropionate/trans-cinnamate dioxygenase ferredoxin subunit
MAPGSGHAAGSAGSRPPCDQRSAMSAPDGTGGWVRACSLAGLGEDSPVHVDIGECPVCLVRTGGAVYALRDECTHESVPLSDGDVADGTIECWKHGSRFDLVTGRVLSLPATRPVAVFGVRIDGEDVYVQLGSGGNGPVG